MSAKSLSQTMREVSIRGPHDSDTWHNLVSRADVIVASFNAKQSALVLNSLARIEDKKIMDSHAFIIRFVKKFLPATVRDMNGLDLAQVIHAIGAFRSLHVSEDLKTAISTALPVVVGQMDSKSLSMTAFGLSRLALWDATSFVLQRALDVQDSLEDQSLAQIVSLVASCGAADDAKQLQDLMRCVIQRVPSISVRSLSLSLNSFARLKVDNSHLVNLVGERILDAKDTAISRGASLSQLVVILRSLQKLGVMQQNPRVSHKLVELISAKPLDERIPSHIACTLLSALSRLPGYTALIDQVFILVASRELSSDQIALLFQVMARSGITSAFESVHAKMAASPHSFTGRQISIIAAACEQLPRELTQNTFTAVAIRSRQLELSNEIKSTDLRSIQFIINKL